MCKFSLSLVDIKNSSKLSHVYMCVEFSIYGVRILNFRLPLAIRGGLLLILVVAVLHTLDRQGEFVSRTDFLWKAKLKVEQEEVETMRGINKVKVFIFLMHSL
jgi:hypothetical protein